MASHKSLCGINITSSDISLVQFNTDDYTIENVAIQPIDSEDPDEWVNIKGTLKRIIRETKIKGRRVSAAVPGGYAIIKKVMVDSSELNPEEAINWEMEQYLLDSINDYYIASEFSGRSEDKSINYFIAVA
ncbi:MAG: pilus assembly protein PilM, partial [Chitinivibrionales bacterium]